MYGTPSEIMRRVEEARKVKVVLAVEAGSRAWGFESGDSDYDIRFVYVRPREAYLRVFDKFPDTITVDKELEGLTEGLYDAVGWDYAKVLFQIRKCNPQLLEWINSPIVYAKNEHIFSHLVRAGKKAYRDSPMIYHYRHMAHGNFLDILRGTPKLKKYLYVLRPVIACRYIIQWGEVPPVNFEATVEAIEDLSCGRFEDEWVRAEIAKLLAWKRKTLERDEVGSLEDWNAYLDLSLSELEEMTPEPEEPSIPTASLNQMFLNALELFDE